MCCANRVPKHRMGERKSRRVRQPGECCHPLLSFIASPHRPVEWAASILILVGAVFFVIFVPFLIVALAGGGRVDYISECDNSLWSFIVDAALNDCKTQYTNASAMAKALDQDEYNFGIGLTQCKGTDALGRGPNFLVPFCKRSSSVSRWDSMDNFDEISYSAFEIIGNEAGKLRMCARMKLALDFPGVTTFDNIVMQRFNGYTACSVIAQANVTKVIEKTVEFNCGDIPRAELAQYLWSHHNSKIHYFMSTCTTPSSGGMLILSSTVEEHEWCNDMYQILRKSSSYTHAWAQDTILHDMFNEEIPACVDHIPLTLYNSYNASCRAL